ncbi:nucleolin-like [Hippocampus comes]|uniref:nucleolin-like n=2 Tax=Hippocampus comes TaxID=109280 RepID=UPI00094E1742|nr:PREDICTED: nucleolin-like [Hippocampus comes]
MKVAFVFVLLFAAVLCRPARKYSDSSAESSEEMVRRPAASLFRKKMADLTRFRVSPFRLFQKFLAPIALGSDEITAGSDEAAVEIPALVNFETPDEAATDTPSVDNQDEPSKDGDDEDDEDDDDDDEDESEESESEEEDEEDSSESGESSTVAPETATPVIVTEEPLLPTIVTDTDSGRGDSMGGYPSEYKSYVYAEEKTYHKAPSSYKSYEYVDAGKKSGYDMPIDNEVEKSPEVYKSETYQEHNDMLEEDTSTPENQDALPAEEATDGTSDSGSSADAEEEEQSETEQSSEETTATPGAADSDSDESDSMESDSDERETGRETTDMPVVITAK